MRDKCFIDSNILCYLFDERFPEKQLQAQNLIKELSDEKKGVISTQSIQEFSNVAIKKFRYSKEVTLYLAKSISNEFPVYNNRLETVFNALSISNRTQFSFWDSMILASANECNCNILYSEDLNDGQIVSGVKIVNPFR